MNNALRYPEKVIVNNLYDQIVISQTNLNGVATGIGNPEITCFSDIYNLYTYECMYAMGIFVRRLDPLFFRYCDDTGKNSLYQNIHFSFYTRL